MDADVRGGSVRRAATVDAPRLAELSRGFHAASPYEFGFNADRVAVLFAAVIESPSGAVFVISDHEGVIVGFLAATTMPALSSGQLIASELAWWVDPEYRGTKDSFRLLSEYESWAKEQGCQSCSMALISTMPGADVLRRVYERRGYRQLETAFSKVL